MKITPLESCGVIFYPYIWPIPHCLTMQTMYVYPLAPARVLLAALNAKPAAAQRRALLAELKAGYPLMARVWLDNNPATLYAEFENGAFRGFSETPTAGLESIEPTASQQKRIEASRVRYSYKPDSFECWAVRLNSTTVRITK